ncbi:MAG: ROK family protein [Puniceicoccaceae bacterium]
MNGIMGIDIGGTKSAVCLGTGNGDVQAREEIPTRGDPMEVIGQLASIAESLVGDQGPVQAIGIVCGNPMDARKGLILSPPNLPGWDHVDVVGYFQERFGQPVRLMNDANAGALAEWHYGAGQGTRNMIFCTMGTGFGCGLILGGRLYEGANGNAGEIGHVRLTPDGPEGYGKAGSVEGWCSGGGIARLAEGYPTTKALAEAAKAGDREAMGIFETVGERLGMALSMTVDLFNPEVIVIGSIFVRCEELLRPAMERVMQRECLPSALEVCRVVPAALGEAIGDKAALAVANLALEESCKTE